MRRRRTVFTRRASECRAKRARSIQVAAPVHGMSTIRLVYGARGATRPQRLPITRARRFGFAMSTGRIFGAWVRTYRFFQSLPTTAMGNCTKKGEPLHRTARASQSPIPNRGSIRKAVTGHIARIPTLSGTFTRICSWYHGGKGQHGRSASRRASE